MGSGFRALAANQMIGRVEGSTCKEKNKESFGFVDSHLSVMIRVMDGSTFISISLSIYLSIYIYIYIYI